MTDKRKRLDFVGDNNPTILSFAKEAGIVPEYVTGNTVSVEGLQKNAFADPEVEEFPCHTKEATWLSAAYAINNADEEVCGRILKMAHMHGIGKDVAEVMELFGNTMLKSAAAADPVPAEPKYAYMLEKGASVYGVYEITNAYDTKYSANKLANEFRTSSMDPEIMEKTASAIVEAAKEQGVYEELPAIVRTYGESRLPDVANASLSLTNRPHVEKYAAVLQWLDDAINDTKYAEEAIELAKEAASMITELDDEHGVVYGYNNPDAYTALFTGPTLDEFNKAANSVINIQDVFVPVAEFTKLASEDITDRFSPTHATVISEAIVKAASDVSAASTMLDSIGEAGKIRLLKLIAE